MNEAKTALEKALKDYFTAKEYYEYAIDNQKDLKEVVDNLEKYDQIAYEQADKFYDTLIKNQDEMNDEELKENWKLFRKYFEESI